MPYSVKLKDQTGTEIIYTSVEQVSLPQVSGTTPAEFMAKYSVTKSPVDGITYKGGDTTAHGVDYLCYITSTGSLATSVTVYIADVKVNVGDGYTYTVNGNSALLYINGNKITGNILINASKS